MPAQVLCIRGARVDRHGEVCRLLAAFALQTDPLEKERKQLEAEMRAWYDAAPAEHTETVDGRVYTVEIGAKRLERRVCIPKLIKRLGRKIFDSVATVPLNVVDRLIPATEQTGVVTAERTGSRPIKSVLRMAAERIAS